MVFQKVKKVTGVYIQKLFRNSERLGAVTKIYKRALIINNLRNYVIYVVNCTLLYRGSGAAETLTFVEQSGCINPTLIMPSLVAYYITRLPNQVTDKDIPNQVYAQRYSGRFCISQGSNIHKCKICNPLSRRLLLLLYIVCFQAEPFCVSSTYIYICAQATRLICAP